VFRSLLSRFDTLPVAGRLLRRFAATAEDEAGRRVGDADGLPIRPADRRAVLQSLLAARFHDAGIECHCADGESAAYCAILDKDVDGAARVLQRLATDLGVNQVVVWQGRGYGYGAEQLAESLQPADVAGSDSLVVAVPIVRERLRIGRSGGVEVLIVGRQGPRYVARRDWAGKVDWTQEFAGSTSVPAADGEAAARPSCSRRPRQHVLDREPVDAVYTWVDSGDADWLAEMQRWASRERGGLESSREPERFADRDELRYSLRSLWLYAPFVRNVFIVTSGQVPRWLDGSHDRVRVVPHRDIFPDRRDLPTFNSHAIEACLHRIEGLAEHFIYFNDDVFLLRETTPGTFFTRNGLAKSRFSTRAAIPAVEPGPESIPTDWASYNAATFIERDFGLRFDRKLKHVPMPMKKSVLADLETRYADEFEATRRARFRSSSDIAVPSMLAHLYGICAGQAVEWQHVPGEYVYADSGRSDIRSKLEQMLEGPATFACINSTRFSDVSTEEQRDLLARFFEQRFPFRSPFEIEGRRPGAQS